MTATSQAQRLSAPARALQVLSVAAMFALFSLGGVLYSWLILPIARIYMWRRPERERILGSQRLVAPGYRSFMNGMRWLKFLDFDPSKFSLDIDRPTVVIANHPTLIDVLAFLSVAPNLICIVKPSVASSLVFSRTLRYCGCVAATGAEHTIAGAIERLQMGFSVLIFPEGTRSPVGELGKIRRGAFEMAKAADAPVLPVVIRCSPPALTHGMAWHEIPPQPAHYRLQAGPEVHMTQWQGSTRKAAAHHQELFASAMRQLQDETPYPKVAA